MTYRQMLALGCSQKAIRSRVEAGRLHRVHRGVYAVGRPPVMPLERAAAAVLACGHNATLAHRSGLSLWDLRTRWEWPAHVMIAAGDRRPTGIVVHRCRALARRDLTVQRGIRVTSPARTLLDCAPSLTGTALTRAVNDALLARLTRPAELAELLSRNPNHPGVGRLAGFVDPGVAVTRSDFEVRFGALCARYGLPAPVFNSIVGGYEVDAFFPEQRLIVELDSWAFHQHRTAFERDRERDVEHLAAGLRTARLTWERLHDAPEREARRLAAILRC